MFNSSLKREWLSRLESMKADYVREMTDAQKTTVELFETSVTLLN